MSGFKALNIESDDESDVEIDDTKEIQIEEALRLYQIALKFHSEGPPSFDKAAEAYEQLFQSEIFKYPESQAELQRIELYGLEAETNWDDEAAGPVVNVSGFDTGPSTLPQILHLSHKNYAQFKLDVLAAKLRSSEANLSQIKPDTNVALKHFVQALDKDDSDIDLWQRTASVGELLDSTRVTRFCLESVIDGDGEGLDGLLATPGLEEGIAAEQLRSLIVHLQDSLSILQDQAPPKARKAISRLLRERLRPYNDLLQKKAALQASTNDGERPQPKRTLLGTPGTWADAGEALVAQYLNDQAEAIPASTNYAVYFGVDENLPQLPISAPQITSDPMEIDQPAAVELNMPATMGEMFPGLDAGRPTVQPRIAPADASMQQIVDQSEEHESASRRTSARKRSGETAGLQDGAEEGRTKSKRLRARESNADSLDAKQALIDANTRWEYEQQLNEVQAADDWMFETVGNLFEKVGIVGFDAARHVRQELQASDSDIPAPKSEATSLKSDLKHIRADLQGFLENFKEPAAQLFLRGGAGLDMTRNSSVNIVKDMFTTGGTTKPARRVDPMPNDGLRSLLSEVNEQWLPASEAAWLFIQALLAPRDGERSPYVQYMWPESLKTCVVRVLVNIDEVIYSHALDEFSAWRDLQSSQSDAARGESVAEMIQAIYELHLDVYCLISQANSGVDEETITYQLDRLERWAELAREVLHFRTLQQEQQPPDLADSLNLRFLWATTFQINASPEVPQEYGVQCMNDLRSILTAADEPLIQLQNNAIMPEVSLATLDREISKLTLRDFFTKITSENDQEPAAVIEGLEPLLESLNPLTANTAEENGADGEDEPLQNASQELIRFLQTSDLSLRLSLWRRLRDAYVNIDYNPMAVYCSFRMLGLVLDDLKSENVKALAGPERQTTALKALSLFQEMIKELLTLISASSDALVCIDQIGLTLAVTTLGEILQLVQVFNVIEDSMRLGQTQPPQLPNGTTSQSFTTITKAVHELQVQIWIVLYGLLKEAIAQNQSIFTTPDEDRFDFLRVAHRNLGIRGICGAYKRAFVRMLKDEFFKLTHVDGYDSEQAQVLYDIYGINCFLNPSYELIEHHCTHDAFLDRGVATQTVDLLMMQASKIPMKELVKHTIKDTIEKVHGTLPRSKKTEALMRNRELYRSFFKSPINPLDLYRSLRGEGNQLQLTSIPKEDAPIAYKGWYFLMGHIALTKFRSQKRTGPTPTEDLDIAVAFFSQDLDCSMENWETWFRLAQTFDMKIEESVLWSAEKLNTSMQEIILLQKSAIHCYTMALALAQRSASFEFETSSKMTELYADFATRLYSSSREPFGMQAFAVSKEDFDKFVTSGGGVEKVVIFEPLRHFTAWKLASVLFKKAIAGKSDNWMWHYLLGKCLWKMHSAPEERKRAHDKPPTGEQVLDAFIRALELSPKKDSRDSRKEPVLEPHYKLLIIVHKLVVRDSISFERAKEALQHSQYAQREEAPADKAGWVPYVLDILKALRAADKSNWYHRMVMRSAQLIHDYVKAGPSEQDGVDVTASEGGGLPNPEGARQELTQQMITKTRGLQIWKPETERPGRHFVYTARYTRYFIHLLRDLKDRVWMELMARRVRKKPNDVFEHNLVWADLCTTYIQLLRSFAGVSEGLETSTFSNIFHDEFLLRKEPLENWMQTQEPGTSIALDVLREAHELKKINIGMTKTGTIDDLIGDAYANLFNTVGRQLWEEQQKSKQERDEINPPPPAAEQPAQPAPAPPPTLPPSPARHPTMSLNHLMNSDDVVAKQEPPEPTAAVGSTQAAAAAATDAAPVVRRKTGVGRREIRAAAESCLQKPAAPTPAAVGRGGPSQPVRPHAVVEIQRQPGLSGEISTTTSAPGSIHDSADDESELSELEEEGDEDEAAEKEAAQPVHRPMFPGLTTLSRASEEKTRETGQEDVEMGEDEDEDGEGEGEEGNEEAEEEDENEEGTAVAGSEDEGGDVDRASEQGQEA